MWLSKKLFAVSFAELGVFGLGSSYSNLMLVGLPIISARLGDDALLPLFLLVSVHSAVLFFVAAITVESGENNGRSPRYIALRTSKTWPAILSFWILVFPVFNLDPL